MDQLEEEEQKQEKNQKWQAKGRGEQPSVQQKSD